MPITLTAGINIKSAAGTPYDLDEEIGTTTGQIVYADVLAGQGVTWSVEYVQGTDSGIKLQFAELPVGFAKNSIGASGIAADSNNILSVLEKTINASTAISGFTSGLSYPVGSIDPDGKQAVKLSELVTDEWLNSSGTIRISAISGKASDGS